EREGRLGEQVDQPQAEGRLDGVGKTPPLLDDVLVAERRHDTGHVALDRIDVQLHGRQYDIKMMSVKCDMWVQSVSKMAVGASRPHGKGGKPYKRRPRVRLRLTRPAGGAGPPDGLFRPARAGRVPVRHRARDTARSARDERRSLGSHSLADDPAP